jgi:DNA-binding CsgD family transcriptional regulator
VGFFEATRTKIDMPTLPSMSTTARPVRQGSIGAAIRLMNALDHAPADPVLRKRQLVADLCRILGEQLGQEYNAPTAAAPRLSDAVSLSPRMRQTLERLLAGDSEKEIAARLGLSRHTVHVYVKTLYRRFGVCSRGELFARFVRR